MYDEFQTRKLLGYRAGDQNEKRTYQRATRTMESICESLFYGIKRRIRDPNTVEDDEPATVDEFEQMIIEEVRTKADEIIQSM